MAGDRLGDVADSLAISSRMSSSSWWKLEREVVVAAGSWTTALRRHHQPNRPVTYCSVRSSSGLEKIFGRVVLDEAAGAPVALGVDLGGEERGAVAHPGRLLHVVGDDHDRVLVILISCISSSMRAVAIGSSAEHGSSIRITSGSTAIARAMHSRCC